MGGAEKRLGTLVLSHGVYEVWGPEGFDAGVEFMQAIMGQVGRGEPFMLDHQVRFVAVGQPAPPPDGGFFTVGWTPEERAEFARKLEIGPVGKMEVHPRQPEWRYPGTQAAFDHLVKVDADLAARAADPAPPACEHEWWSHHLRDCPHRPLRKCGRCGLIADIPDDPTALTAADFAAGNFASCTFSEAAEAIAKAAPEYPGRGPGRVGFDALAAYDACEPAPATPSAAPDGKPAGFYIPAEFLRRIPTGRPPGVTTHTSYAELYAKLHAAQPTPPDAADPDDDDADDTPVVVTDPE